MPLFSKKIVPTEITSNIEKATSPSVTELDWALVFQICNAVNSTDLGAKEARKLLQKKMMFHGNPKTQVLGLEILNSLNENCGEKFPPQLAAKSFGEDLYTLASSKTTDDRVHGKLAQCLEIWNSQYGNDPNFGGIRRAYDVLMNGITPTHRRPTSSIQGGEGRGFQTMPREPPKPRDVKSDIELAKNSAQLFSQTLSFTDPTKEDISKNELIQEFYGKCKQSQQLIASHLETCEDSDVISSLINANNELLSCFKSYDEMLEQHAVNEATVNSQTLHNRNTRNPNEQQQQQQQPLVGEELISTSASSSAAAQSQQAAPQIHQQYSNDPFDPFADTNQVPVDNNNTSFVNTAGNNTTTMLPPPITPQRMHNE